jgi:esterase/lipase superfamily enzyme
MHQPSPGGVALQYIDPALPKEIFGWHSPRLGLDMPIVRYGNRGHALLLFPTAQADFLENERFFLIKSVERFIFEGRVQVFSIDSINRHAWMNRHVPVPEAARRQNLYSGYIEEEVVPHIRRCLGDPSARIGASGASFGAFYAANAVLRRPDLFDTLIAMSGFYDLGPDYLHGYSDDNVYFNNPLSFLPNLQDHGVLEALRRTQFHIISGQGAYEAPHASVRLAHALAAKGIPHNLDLWGHDVNHDWPWWRRMLPHYIGERVGW